MTFEITKADVWVSPVENLPGQLARQLEAVVDAGANLGFIVARAVEKEPRAGVLFIGSLQTEQERAAAEAIGLKRSGIHVLRVEGPDRPGLVACIARTLGEADINICGISAAAIGERGVVYVRLETDEDVIRAGDLLTPGLEAD